MTDGNVQILKKSKGIAGFKTNFEYLLLEGPALVLVFIFCYLPMVGIILPFKDYHFDMGIFKSPWVGFENFKFLFTSQDLWQITRNTILLNLLFIFVGLLFSVVIALMLFEIRSKSVVKAYQTVLILPSFLSWVVVGYMTYALLNPELGLLNHILESLGLNAVSWYTEPGYWPIILLIVSIWKGAGLSSILYYATLLNINEEYFEAARIDGASRLQMIRFISIPFLVPIMIVLTILAIGGIIRSDFGMFFSLTRNVSMLYSTTDVIDTYVYRALRAYGDIGMSSAVGIYQSFVGFALIVLTNAVVRKIQKENSIF